jgi:radical SAM superfamily enzyme YgiQ (UPF0313 family)
MVFLINAPSELEIPTLPLGLAYLAAYLIEHGVRVKVLDAWAEGWDYQTLADEVAAIEPSIVGISMVSPNYENVKKTAEFIKARVPRAKIVLGGYHPSALPREILSEIPAVDFVVTGEGEATFLELVRAINNGENDFNGIRGIAFRAADTIRINHARDYIKNLDTLPFPARDLFPISRYRTVAPYGKRRPFVSLISSRGCPYTCSYCCKVVFGSNYRYLSAGRVIQEVKLLIERYSVKEIRFYDDIFTFNKERLYEICSFLLREKNRPIWSCLTRPELIDQAMLKVMQRAGCWLVAYGVESANKDILEKLNRFCHPDIIRRAFKWTRQAGIRSLAYFMIGLPQESKDMIKDTINFAVELRPDYAAFSNYVLMPGSVLYDQVVSGCKQSWLRHPKFVASKSTVFPFSRQDRTYVDGLSLDELDRVNLYANRRFYFRPGYIINQLLNTRSPSELVYNFSNGIKLMRHIFIRKGL